MPPARVRLAAEYKPARDAHAKIGDLLYLWPRDEARRPAQATVVHRRLWHAAHASRAGRGLRGLPGVGGARAVRLSRETLPALRQAAGGLDRARRHRRRRRPADRTLAVGPQPDR